MLKSQLDQRLREIVKGPARGDVGIELEIEGTLHHVGDNPYWMSKDEGSLRNGIEYVLLKPIEMKNLDAALDSLHQTLSKCKPKLSIRCSTHVHVNVLNKTIRQIYTILAYYFMIEDILLATQGPIRQGNLFCLRMSDAEYISESLQRSIKEETHFRVFSQGSNKYGAVNLAAPGKFGSLEFRFLRPIIDMSLMRQWVWLLYNLVENSAALTLKQVTESAMKPAREFLSMVFSKDQIEFITEGRSDHELQEMMMKNFDHVSKLRHHLYKKKTFYIPEEFLDDDLEGSPFRMVSKKAAFPQHSLDMIEEWTSIPIDEMEPD